MLYAQMNVLCIGDPHFKKKSIIEYEQFIKEINLVLLSHKIDIVVILGDLLDRHSIADITQHTDSIEWIRTISKSHQVLLLIGNHDRINNQDFLSKYHFFHGLEDNKNITICDRVKIIEINGFKLIGVPYVFPGRFKEALNTVSDYEKSDIIFAHQEIRGVKLNKDIVSEKGDIWDNDKPLLISGHIHKYNKLADNIIYTGSPFQHNFGEINDLKTISLFSISRDKFNNSTKINNIYYYEQRIELNIKKKIKLDVLFSQIDNLVIPQNCQIRITIQADSSEIKTFKYKNIINYWKSIGIDVKQQLILDKSNRSVIFRNNSEKANWLSEFKKFCYQDSIKKQIYTELFLLHEINGKIK